VSKAIRRSGGNKAGTSEASAKETQGYVPAATMYLYEYHNEHGIKADRAVVHFATDDQKQMSFKQVADLRCSYCAMQLLNPSYKLNIIPLQRRESLFDYRRIAAFVSNETKCAYVQHELYLKENPFQNSRAVVKSDENSSETRTTTRSATKILQSKTDNLGLIANKL
jgi:membrane-bound lytic murein transglycosylase D